LSTFCTFRVSFDDKNRSIRTRTDPARSSDEA